MALNNIWYSFLIDLYKSALFQSNNNNYKQNKKTLDLKPQI